MFNIFVVSVFKLKEEGNLLGLPYSSMCHENLKSVYKLCQVIQLLIGYLNTPRIGSPFCIATLLFISRTAPAPSLTWLELPETQASNE